MSDSCVQVFKSVSLLGISERRQCSVMGVLVSWLTDTFWHSSLPEEESPQNLNDSHVPVISSNDMFFDDDGLSALEKIYLYSRSSASFHRWTVKVFLLTSFWPIFLERIFIARSLPVFLPDVSPSDAVEYVIPLINGLGMDDGVCLFYYITPFLIVL